MEKYKTHTMTWLQYYQAVKSADLDTIRKATDKDFRISLTIDRSAIELSALHGNHELFDYFLQKCDKKKDSEILARVLKDALRAGDVKLAVKVVVFLGSVNYDKFSGDFYLAALHGGSIDCVKFVRTLVRPKARLKNLYLQEAFYKVGSGEILEYMMTLTGVKDASLVAATVGVPTHFINIALNRWAAVYSYIQRSEQWHERNCVWTPMDVAAMFGRVEILNKLVDAMNFDQRLYFHRNMTSTLSFALRKNRTGVLKYLIEHGIAKPGHPCEYPGFEINEAFNYLNEERGDVKYQDYRCKENAFRDNLKDCLKVMYDHPYYEKPDYQPKALSKRELKKPQNRTKYWRNSNSASRLTQVGAFYEYLVEKWKWGDAMKDPNFDILYIRALAEQNVDAALALKKLTKKLDCTTQCFHRHLVMSMYVNPRKYGIITSPVIVELVLELMKGEKSCCCKGWFQSKNIMRLFFRSSTSDSGFFFDVKNDDFSDITIEYGTSLPLELLVKRTEAVYSLFLEYGYEKPNMESIIDDLTDFFRMKEKWSLAAARVLCIVQCCKVDDEDYCGELINHDRDSYMKWFGEKWSQRDEFLTEFMIALSRNGWSTELDLQCIELYSTFPKKRAQHFNNLLAKTGLKTRDCLYDDEYTDYQYMEESDVWYHYVKQRPRPTLQDYARFAVHKQCLKVANSNSSYVSAKSLVRDVSELLPKRLGKFLQYSDVYETLDYEDDRIYPGLVRRMDLDRFLEEPSWGFDMDLFDENWYEWSERMKKKEYPEDYVRSTYDDWW